MQTECLIVNVVSTAPDGGSRSLRNAQRGDCSSCTETPDGAASKRLQDFVAVRR
jgi:hypothetical protein